MKRIFALIISLMLVMCLFAACGDDDTYRQPGNGTTLGGKGTTPAIDDNNGSYSADPDGDVNQTTDDNILEDGINDIEDGIEQGMDDLEQGVNDLENGAEDMFDGDNDVDNNTDMNGMNDDAVNGENGNGDLGTNGMDSDGSNGNNNNNNNNAGNTNGSTNGNSH